MCLPIQVRESGFKDYIAVDEVQDGKIMRTPVYLQKGKPVKARVYDTSEARWYVATVTYQGLVDKQGMVHVLCDDGMDYDEFAKNLVNPYYYQILK